LAGFLALMIVGAVVWLVPHTTNAYWVGGLLAAMFLLPVLLKRMLPRRNLMAFRLALAAYPVNVLLLTFITFMELWRADPFPVADFPALGRLFPWVGFVVPGVYAVLQFPHWVHRLSLYPELVRTLAQIPPVADLGEVSGLIAEAVSAEPSLEATWAEFRSLPATPSNWRLFLRLDTQEHGVWRVAFAPAYALVLFGDGRLVEAVPKGGLKLVADDPKPGNKAALCLLRWNAHLMEGRITPDNFLKMKAWNKIQAPESA
jgi:hypothetical protein